ncbi:MAG TPA: GAF domain-containing protein, partial [Candidatus Limnocylindria bacterium]|nr:GAF domain-containing protein [Candidatus Limnocylindria bacterium]
MTTPQPRPLLLPPLLEAIEAWRADPTAARVEALRDALGVVADALGLRLGRLDVAAPPLPGLALEMGAEGAEHELRLPGEAEPIGRITIAGDPAQAGLLARALEMGLMAARDRARAERAEAQLMAMDQAVRGIGGVLDVDRVLQLIVDRVRDLVQAQYAALGIVDAEGAIERFITSGISDEARERIGELPRGRGLLGLIIRENRTYRVRDIATHPERYGFPPNHPEMHSFLGMPITARGVAVGRLYLTNKLAADEFSPDDQALVEMFALHAGIAIENARLHDQVRRLAIVDERDRISR